MPRDFDVDLRCGEHGSDVVLKASSYYDPSAKKE